LLVIGGCLHSGLFVYCSVYRFSNLPMLFFFNDTAPTEIYTLSLHDALPICLASTGRSGHHGLGSEVRHPLRFPLHAGTDPLGVRSEEHTSELQSRENLVCRLLLEKKKKIKTNKL